MQDNILLNVRKPGQYAGNEFNAIRKDPEKVGLKFALCFPDLYELGMSHLGVKIIYSILNKRPDVLCERFFAPWVDMEAALRERNLPLVSLENKIPMNQFDIVGFSLSSELSYTNVLTVLDLAKIPIFAKMRTGEDPLVIAGGVCCLNPAPMSDFFDAFLVGDGEEAILEIVDAFITTREDGRGTRDETLKRLAAIEGVYVPGISAKVRRRTIKDLNEAHHPTDFVVPNVEVVHDRAAIEIMRGCPFRCGFCQANVGYYPKRTRSAENVLRLAAEAIRKTGYDEVSLLSLSSANYPHLLEVMEKLAAALSGSGVSVSLPSLRVDKVTKELPALLAKTKRTGLTIAPEAGSDRLRRVINKPIEIDELYKAFRCALEYGWRRIKLYFMIGLPTEEYADLDGIADIVNGLRREADRMRAFCELRLSISTFIPKPHTAFEREGMDSAETIRQKRGYLSERLRKNRLKVDFHDERIGFLEAVLSRGDKELGKVIFAAHQSGARFDGWRDQFRFDLWLEAFAKAGIDPSFYANRKIADKEVVGWHCVDAAGDAEGSGRQTPLHPAF